MCRINEKLKKIRAGYGLSQAKFAKPIGLKQAVYQRYEKGGQAIPYSVIESIATQYKVNSDWLLKDRGDPYSYNELESDEQWKRLNIIRNRTRAFHGTPRIAAEMLGVELDTYKRWEMGLEPIPAGIVDRIYGFVNDYVRKAWWYEGKGEMFKEDPLTGYQPPNEIRKPTGGEEFEPEISLDSSAIERGGGQDRKWTQKDIDDFRDVLQDLKQNPDIPREVMFEVIKLFVEDRSDNSGEEN